MDNPPAKQPDPPLPENGLPALAPDPTAPRHASPNWLLGLFVLLTLGAFFYNEHQLRQMKLLGDLSDLVHSVQEQGSRTEHERLLRRLLSEQERQLGPQHAQTLKTLSQLAGLVFAKGDLSEAESLLRRELAVQERTLDPEHPDTLRNLSRLGMLWLSATSSLKTCTPVALGNIGGVFKELDDGFVGYGDAVVGHNRWGVDWFGSPLFSVEWLLVCGHDA